MAYTPPPGNSITFNFTGEYTPVRGDQIVFNFGGSGSGIYPVGIAAPDTGAPQVANLSQGIQSFGFDSLVLGAPVAASPQTVSSAGGIHPGFMGGPDVSRPPYDQLTVSGILSFAAGTPSVVLRYRKLSPTGIAGQAFGATRIYNLRQYIRPTGYRADVFGTAYLIGGVKYIYPAGRLSLTFGSIVVINTTADQTAKPSAIAAPSVPLPSVSPRMLRPNGFVGSVGSPLVQRNPSPLGFDNLRLGSVIVDYKTKYALPSGVLGYETGYPRVYDPTQEIQAPSFIQSAVFGDTAIKNKNLFIGGNSFGFESSQVSPWATVESNRRVVTAISFSSQAIGVASAENATPSFAPVGIDSLRMGSAAAVGFRIRHIGPSGIYRTTFGLPALTKTPELKPSGFAGVAGIPTVWHKVRYVYPAGSSGFSSGAATTWFRYRNVSVTGFAAQAFSNGSKAEHSRRTITGSGSDASRLGSLTIQNADRTLSPPSIFENFAHSHMVGGLRFLNTVGFVASRFGTRIIPVIQSAYPSGFAGAIGLPALENRTKIVHPPSIKTTPQPADSWGKPMVWNSRQYISHNYDANDGLSPPSWPQWTKIENRKKALLAFGADSSRVSQPSIFNNARLVSPSGAPSPSTDPAYKAGMVSHRIRPLQLQGIEAPHMPYWHAVYNDARVIPPGGLVASMFGTHSFANNRRYFPYIGAFDASVVESPMIAPRIRTISFEGRYTIGSPPIQLPEVKLYTRYIDGIGFDSYRTGAASLSIHRAIITTRWTLQNFYGTPSVVNNTPELLTRGRASDEFGNLSIRLQWRPVAHMGNVTEIFGKADIAYRDRSIYLSGIRSGDVSTKTKVQKLGAPPYSTQNIWLDQVELDGEVHFGHGIGIPDDQVGEPIINQQVIYLTGFSMSRYGDHRVAANSIRIEPGYHELLVGDHMVSLKIRTLEVEGIASKFESPKPRVTPHTIYSVVDAPQQARMNHPVQGGLHVVNSVATYGRPTVSLRHRKIFIGGSNHSRLNNPSIYNRRIYVYPDGIRSLRFGWHVLPGDQTLEQFDSSNTALYGRPAVTRPPYVGPQTVRPSGFSASLWGANRVELFNRTLLGSGFLSMRMGTKLDNDKPYMWQGLRVGPLVPLVAGGIDTSASGTPLVSFRVREALVDGFDAFRCEYDFTDFESRMRVRRTEQPIQVQTITPMGIHAFDDSVPNVRLGAHFIRPDGNSEQFRKGAF